MCAERGRLYAELVFAGGLTIAGAGEAAMPPLGPKARMPTSTSTALVDAEIMARLWGCGKEEQGEGEVSQLPAFWRLQRCAASAGRCRARPLMASLGERGRAMQNDASEASSDRTEPLLTWSSERDAGGSRCRGL